jgi:hypothetical protein
MHDFSQRLLGEIETVDGEVDPEQVIERALDCFDSAVSMQPLSPTPSGGFVLHLEGHVQHRDHRPRHRHHPY